MSEIVYDPKNELQCALALAIYHDNFFEVRYLVEVCGAEVNGTCYRPDKTEKYQAIPDMQDVNIAEYAGAHCNNPHILDLLFNHGLDADATLRACVNRYAYEIAFLCLMHKADPNLLDENGETMVYNLFQTISEAALLATLPSNMYVTLCVLYQMGYKDDGDRILKGIKQSNNPDLLEILDIWTPTDEECVSTVDLIKTHWDAFYPYKNPYRYFNSAVLKPTGEM